LFGKKGYVVVVKEKSTQVSSQRQSISKKSQQQRQCRLM